LNYTVFVGMFIVKAELICCGQMWTFCATCQLDTKTSQSCRNSSHSRKS